METIARITDNQVAKASKLAGVLIPIDDTGFGNVLRVEVDTEPGAFPEAFINGIEIPYAIVYKI